jgi:sporulation protein YtfJ
LADGRGSHPIEALMKTAMESLKSMIDVNTVVGEAVGTPDGTTIIPISRVTFGFAAGGGEYGPDGRLAARPFGGGSGAGVSVHPVGFLVQRGDTVRILPVDGDDMWVRLLDLAPQVVETMQDLMGTRHEPHEFPAPPPVPDAAGERHPGAP